MNEAITSKITSIKRCLNRIKEEYEGHENELSTNFSKQDAIVLNLQRACETTIDLGAYLVRINKLGVPQSTREIFETLAHHQILPEDLAESLKGMVGFRNIAVHEYQKPNLDIIQAVIKTKLTDFEKFIDITLKHIVK